MRRAETPTLTSLSYDIEEMSRTIGIMERGEIDELYATDYHGQLLEYTASVVKTLLVDGDKVVSDHLRAQQHRAELNKERLEEEARQAAKEMEPDG